MRWLFPLWKGMSCMFPRNGLGSWNLAIQEILPSLQANQFAVTAFRAGQGVDPRLIRVLNEALMQNLF